MKSLKNLEFQNQCFHRQDHPVKFMEWQTKVILEKKFQSEEQQEISRQHCLDSAVLNRDKPKIHTEPAAFC